MDAYQWWISVIPLSMERQSHTEYWVCVWSPCAPSEWSGTKHCYNLKDYLGKPLCLSLCPEWLSQAHWRAFPKSRKRATDAIARKNPPCEREAASSGGPGGGTHKTSPGQLIQRGAHGPRPPPPHPQWRLSFWNSLSGCSGRGRGRCLAMQKNE